MALGKTKALLTFIIRELVEKSIEYNKPADLCYVDLKNAFDGVTKIDIAKIIQDQEKIRT